MLIYYFLIIIPLLVLVVGRIKKKKFDKLCITIFFIIFFVMLSLRSIECGTDLKSYFNVFNSTSVMSMSNVFKYHKDNQVLFFIFNKLISLFTSDFQIYLVCVACISIFPILYLYKKELEDYSLTIALFLTVAPFGMFFSGIKQSIAMGIIILAFRLIKKNKFIKYILMVLVAMLFHKSAIYCVLLYPLYHINITKKWLYFIVPLMILIFIFRAQIFGVMINYADPSYLERYNIIESNGAYSILILLILFGVYCFIFPDKNKIDRDFIGLRNFLLLSICIQCFASVNPIVMRINYYILLFIPILIPKVKYYCKKDNVKIINMLSFIITSFLFTYFFYNGYYGVDVLNIYPYIPYWRL